MTHSIIPDRSKGFTLIELLIVIAIILILIAIALPNFLEAQIRAKVARVDGDLRSLSVAIESYHLDRKVYPYLSVSSLEYTPLTDGLRWLTFPVAYIHSLPIDPFSIPAEPLENFYTRGTNYKLVSTTPLPMGGLHRLTTVDAYHIYSYGPNHEPDSNVTQWPFSLLDNPCKYPFVRLWSYSPTNGTSSVGEIFLFGGEFRAGNWCLDGVVIRGRDSHLGVAWNG